VICICVPDEFLKIRLLPNLFLSAIWWGYGDRGDHHPARLEIKRYLAVLGNPHLRQKWLRI